MEDQKINKDFEATVDANIWVLVEHPSKTWVIVIDNFENNKFPWIICHGSNG